MQYALLKIFTVPSALLTKFAKTFHTKLLESAFIFTKWSMKTLCFDAAMFHLSIKSRPHSSYCFLSMFKLHCKRHYRNLARYSWCTTWREHVTKNGAGATPTFGRRRRRADQLRSAAASAKCQRRTALLGPPSMYYACSLIMSSHLLLIRHTYKQQQKNNRTHNWLLALVCCYLEYHFLSRYLLQ